MLNNLSENTPEKTPTRDCCFSYQLTSVALSELVFGQTFLSVRGKSQEKTPTTICFGRWVEWKKVKWKLK